MIDWLAVIVFCVNGECALLAGTQTPYKNRESCEAQVLEMSRYFKENAVEPILAVCLPIEFLKV